MSKYFAVFAYNLRGNGDVASVTRPEGGIGLPGGKVEKGENEIEALRRECEEEGWLIQIKDRTKPFFERETKDGNWIAYYKTEHAFKLFRYKEQGRIENMFSKFWKISKSGNGNGGATKTYFRKLIQKILYKNWGFHNIISHPLSQICYAFAYPIYGKKYADKVANRVHDWSIPDF